MGERKEREREGGREESDKKWPVGLVWDPPPAADVQCAVCQLFVLLVPSVNQEACIENSILQAFGPYVKNCLAGLGISLAALKLGQSRFMMD